MPDLAELLANGVQLTATYTDPQSKAVHRFTLTVRPGAATVEQPATPSSGPSQPARQEKGPSSPRTDWRTTPHEFAGKPGKACPRCGRGEDDDLHALRDAGPGRSADPDTGEHNDAHEPTDDHDHDRTIPDVVLSLTEIGYAQPPETPDHWHPNAPGHAERFQAAAADDWQAGPAQPDEVPF